MTLELSNASCGARFWVPQNENTNHLVDPTDSEQDLSKTREVFAIPLHPPVDAS